VFLSDEIMKEKIVGNIENSPSISQSSSSPRRRRRLIRFRGATVFYFERSQGFSSVPDAGASCLGMQRRHFIKKRCSLAHFRLLARQEKQAIFSLSPSEEETRIMDDSLPTSTTSLPQTPSMMRPMAIRRRRQMLKNAGVDIDKNDTTECQSIRKSRMSCGCTCTNGDCNNETCECALNEIHCQVDQPQFPCSCTSATCQNGFGRIEYDPLRVRTHYLTTMMRLKATQQEEKRLGDGVYLNSRTHIKFF